METDLAIACRKISSSTLSEEEKELLVFKVSQDNKIAEAIKLKDPTSDRFLLLFLGTFIIL